MFYAQFVLSKKGPLAKIWLAAHWERKLSKAQIYETNVVDAVDEILKPKVKMALRTTGHLLLGIVRIYSRKTKYLLADCNEAFLKLKMAFRPGAVAALDIDDAASDVGTSSNGPMLSLPDMYGDLDPVASLPDFNEAEFNAQLQMNQSRIDDITLKEDDHRAGAGFGAANFSNDFGDDFEMEIDGDHAADMFGGAGAGLGNDFDDGFGASFGVGAGDDDAAEVARRNSTFDQSMGPLALGGDSPMALLSDPAASAPLGGTTPQHDEGEPLPAGGQDEVGATQTSFALDPLNESVNGDRPRIPRRKRKLIIDDQKSISGAQIKANLADFSDTQQALDVAPPTRKLMRLRDASHIEHLYHLPGCPWLTQRSVVKLYQSHLVMRCREEQNAGGKASGRRGGSGSSVRDELQLAEQLEDFDYGGPNAGGAGNATDYPVLDDGDADEQERLLAADLDGGLGGPMSPTSGTPQATPARKTPRSARADRTADEDETFAEADEDRRWTKRTQAVLASIANRLAATDQDHIVLSDLLTKAASRKTAAQKFYTLLVLKKWQAVELRQEGPYADIEISAGPNINQEAPGGGGGANTTVAAH